MDVLRSNLHMHHHFAILETCPFRAVLGALINNLIAEIEEAVVVCREIVLIYDPLPNCSQI